MTSAWLCSQNTVSSSIEFDCHVALVGRQLGEGNWVAHLPFTNTEAIQHRQCIGINVRMTLAWQSLNHKMFLAACRQAWGIEPQNNSSSQSSQGVFFHLKIRSAMAESTTTLQFSRLLGGGADAYGEEEEHFVSQCYYFSGIHRCALLCQPWN